MEADEESLKERESNAADKHDAGHYTRCVEGGPARGEEPEAAHTHTESENQITEG